MKLLIVLLAVILVVSARQAEKQQQRVQQKEPQEQQIGQQQVVLKRSEQGLQQQKHGVSSSSSSESSSSSSSSSESAEQRQTHNKQMKRQPETVLEQVVNKALEKLRVKNLRRMPQSLEQQNEYLQALQAVALVKAFNNTQIKTNNKKQVPSKRFFDPIFFQKRAVRKWIMRGFTQTYMQFSPPSQNELQDAIATFNSLQLGDYTTNGKSGVLISLPITNLKQIVDLWIADGIISANDGAELKLSMDGDEGQKYVKENSNRQNERTLVFSVAGFISLRLSDTETNPTGTLIYAMQKFQFQTALEITYETTKKCIIWGLFCETKVEAKAHQRPITAKQSEDVWNYIKHDTLKNFERDNQIYLKYLDEEADKYERFLPDIFRSDYQKMADNPTTPPDQLIPHDAFDPRSYNL